MTENNPSEMDHEEILRAELVVLRQDHRDLDEAINALTLVPAADSLTIKRLKKKKLMLKDQISRIEDELTPDIPA